MNYLLPVFGKVVFPSAMPFCFSFPPMVAATDSPMRPMVDSVFSAFCGHCIAANGALGREAGPSFSTFSSNDSKFHLLSFQGAMLQINCPIVTGSFETRLKRISFLLVLASRQRWPEGLCRWLLRAAVVSPCASTFQKLCVGRV